MNQFKKGFQWITATGFAMAASFGWSGTNIEDIIINNGNYVGSLLDLF